MTGFVLFGALFVFSWKLIGHLLPERLMTPSVQGITDSITVALLAALVAIQTVAAGQQIQFDERIPALALAAILLVFRAPFIVVVILAAACAALLRLAF